MSTHIQEEQIHTDSNIKESESAPKHSRIDSRYWKIGLVAFVVVAALMLLYFMLFHEHTLFGFFSLLGNVILPFVIGAALAYVLKPICQLFDKLTTLWFKHMKDRHKAHILATNLSIAITMTLFLALLVALVMSIIPQVIDSSRQLVNELPEMVDSKLTELEGAFATHVRVQDTLIQWHTQINHLLAGNADDSLVTLITSKITDYLETNLNNLIEAITSSVVSVFTFLVNALIALVSCIYILASRKKFGKQSKMLLYSIFPSKASDRIMDEVRFADKTFSGFVNGRLVEAFLIGVMCYVSMRIFRLPYAPLISIWVGFCNIIPFFGPFAGAIPSAIILLFTGWGNFFTFLVLIIVIGQIDGNILGPKILGKATGISGFWVLFAIMVFGGIWGVTGMIIGIPVFAILYDLVRRLILYGLKKKGRYDLYLEYKEKEERYEQDALIRKQARKERRRQWWRKLFKKNQ